MAATYRKPVDDDVPYEQRLANYAGNKDAGLSEYQRALEVYRGKSAAGDTEGANAAKKWSDQVNTAIGGLGDNYKVKASNTMDTIGQKVNATPFQFKQTAQPFQYNAQADPSYQAALRQAQAGAQTATNNAMVGLGSRGIGNSSVAVDRANQIQQSAIGKVNDTILPQLMQQAYGRYQDENNNEYRTQLANYQAAQDQIGNLSKYAGTLNDLNQRDLDNTYRDNTFAEAQKQNNYDAYLKSVGLTNDLGTGPKADYSLLGSKTGNLSAAGQQQLFDNNMKSEYQSAQLSNMSADNARAAAAEARAAGNQRLGDLFDIWDRTGVAPAGIPGVQAGTKLAGKNGAAGEVDMNAEVDGLLGSLRSGKLTPETALQQLEEDFSVGHYTKPQYEQLRSTIAKLAPSYSSPPTEPTKEQQSSTPSDAQLDKMVPKGAPIQDWKSWYKDPRGRAAGVPFENWQAIYGPRLLPKK